MTTLGSLKTQIAADLGRGSGQAVKIANAIRHSGLWLERNYTFQYMHRFVTFTIDASKTDPRAYAVPARLKQLNFIRLTLDDGSYHYLNRIDPKDHFLIETKTPYGYWLDALDYLWLDNTPDQNYPASMDLLQFTAWDELNDNEENWPLTYGEDFFLYDALIRVGLSVRQNSSFRRDLKAMRDEALNTLINADYSLQHLGQKYETIEPLPANYGTDQYPGA